MELGANDVNAAVDLAVALAQDHRSEVDAAAALLAASASSESVREALRRLLRLIGDGEDDPLLLRAAILLRAAVEEHDS